MPKVIDKILRMGEGKVLKQLEAIAKQVNAIEDEFRSMTDEELRGMTDEFRERLAAGESLDDIMPEAFATVREAVTELVGHAAQLLVAHRLELVLDGVDLLGDGLELLEDLAFAHAKDLVDDLGHENALLERR